MLNAKTSLRYTQKAFISARRDKAAKSCIFKKLSWTLKQTNEKMSRKSLRCFRYYTLILDYA